MAHSINEDCFACGECLRACDAGAISPGDIYEINPEICIDCGTCKMFCMAGAIEGEEEELGYTVNLESGDDESETPLNMIDLLSEALPQFLEKEINVTPVESHAKSQDYYVDPAYKRIVEETIVAINNQIQHNLNPRKFLWGDKEDIEKIGRYIVDNCDMDFNSLCNYVAEQGLHFDKAAFNLELGNFKKKSLLDLFHRRQVEKYVYKDRLGKDEILIMIEGSKTQMEDKKYKNSSAYQDKLAFIKEMHTDEILELMDELTNELLNRGIDVRRNFSGDY